MPIKSSFYNKPVEPEHFHQDLCDNVSEMLLRANPKLSTNIKLMTNGVFVMLESFDACKEISGSKFKNVKTYSKGNYKKDVARFWKNIEPGFAYNVLQEYDDISVKTSFDRQYETFYWSGCEYIDSLEYEEAYGILAPLWLDDKIPERFVIFKVNDPSYWEYLSKHETIKDLDFKTDILDKCEIIKTYDLSESTNLGSYIRRHYNQEGFPSSPITMDEEGIIFNGIGYETGEFTSVKETCGDRMWRHDETVLEFDEYLTSGFERNKLIVANILNLEFLFDDPNAEEFTFSRYFGFYCDAIELDKIEIHKNGLYNIGNVYDFKINDFDLYHNDKFIARNDSGICIPFDSTIYPSGHPIASDYNIVSNVSGIFCLEDIDKNLHTINRTNSPLPSTIRLTDKEMDFGVLKGFVECVDSVTCAYEDNATPSSLRFKIKAPIPGLSKIKLVQNTFQIGEPLEAANYDPNDPSFSYGDGEWALFCCDGTPDEIAKAVVKAFNKTYDVGINAYYDGDTIHLVSVNSAPVYNEFRIEIELNNNATNIEDYFEFPNGQSLFGSNRNAHLKCREELVDKFFVGGYIPSRSHNGFNEIVSIVVDYDNAKISDNRIEFPDGVWYDILLDGDGVYAATANMTKVFKPFVPILKILSFYPVKDIEMSTYHDVTKYGDLGELKYEAEWVSKNLKTENERIINGVEVHGENISFDIEVDGELVNIQINCLDALNIDLFNVSNVVVSDLDANGFYTISFPLSMSNTLFEDNIQFSLTDNFSFDTLSTELNVSNLTYLTSEYERCYENLNPNLMFKSKTQPWICNWVLKNGKDVREKPYRLNTNPVFGQYSFTPDITNYEPNPDHYNQEWMYIMQNPDVLNNLLVDSNLNQRNIWSYISEIIPPVGSQLGYVPTIDDFENELKDCVFDYFDVYFKRDNIHIFDEDTSESFITTTLPDYKNRYSLLYNGSNNTLSETFFRGVKLEFMMKANWDEPIDNNLDNLKIKYGKDLNGYRFSAVILPVNITDGSPLTTKTKVIRNDVFKTITLIQYITVGYDDAFNKYLERARNNRFIASLGSITRYGLYNPYNYVVEHDAMHPLGVNNLGICVKGAGDILVKCNSFDYNDDVCECEIEGTNTSFVEDFGTGNSDKYILVVRYHQYNSREYEIIKINSIESDTLIKGTFIHHTGVDEFVDAFGTEYVNDISYVQNDPTTFSDNIYFIMSCDESWFANKFNGCVVASMRHTINSNQKEDMIYELIDSDGNFHTTENGEYAYALRMIGPQENAKYEYMSLLFDGEYIRYGMLPRYAAPMYRHTGRFTPLRNDVVYFTDPFIREFAENPELGDQQKVEMINKLRHLNTCFDYTLTDFGMMKDVAFHRTNETNNNIFKLTGDDKPIYPTSNRFSIGHRDMNVFNSSWDPWYFTRTRSNTLETDCHGTLSMKENKAFFGSKALAVPDEYTFDVFTYAELKPDEIQTADIIVSENGSHIEMIVNIEQKLVDKLRADIHDLFNIYIDAQYSYGDKNTIDDDIETYVRQNLLKLYQLSDIKLWIRQESASTEPFIIWDGLSMDAEQKKRSGMKESHVMGVNSIIGSSFDKKLVMNTKNNTRYTIGLKVIVIKK